MSINVDSAGTWVAAESDGAVFVDDRYVVIFTAPSGYYSYLYSSFRTYYGTIVYDAVEGMG